MDGRNSIILDETVEERQTGYEEVSNAVAYLREENRQLHQENEKLREVFRVARIKFEKRDVEITSLGEQLETARLRIKTLEEENAFLREELEKEKGKVNLLNKLAFGKKSEKEDPVVEKGHKTRGDLASHKGHGRARENLPVKEQITELPEENRVCPQCGLPYEETGLEKQSDEIETESKYYYVKRYRRKVYRKTCQCPHALVVAPVPGNFIPRGKFSTNFWVDILINKYQNHLPVERQLQQLTEYGLFISRGTIFGGLRKIYLLYLEALYQALIKNLRESDYIHADESGWKIFILLAGKKNYNWFIWVYVAEKSVVFVLDPSRSARAPLKTLFDIQPEEITTWESLSMAPEKRKVLSVDKFSSYKMLERMGLVELAYCWAHQRREFINTGIKYPELTDWTKQAVALIAQLYHLNHQRINYQPPQPAFLKYDAAVREKLAEIRELIDTEYQHPAQIALVNSMKEHWKGLTRFLDNPEISLDNNLSERMLRGPVLGRKNIPRNDNGVN